MCINLHAIYVFFAKNKNILRNRAKIFASIKNVCIFANMKEHNIAYIGAQISPELRERLNNHCSMRSDELGYNFSIRMALTEALKQYLDKQETEEAL